VNNIRTAIHWWLCENCTKNEDVFAPIRSLLGYLFDCANSLYAVLTKEPLPTTASYSAGIKSSGKYGVYIINQLSPRDFFRLRGMLGLVGDMFCIIKTMRNLSDNLDNSTLSSLLDNHLPNLKKYRHARNFFAHFDERIAVAMEEHGVTGELEVRELGIRFTKEAEGCFYLGFCGDTVYYHDKQRDETKPSPKSISLNKCQLADIFSLVTDLYDLVTSHSIHATNYPASKSIYDLN